MTDHDFLTVRGKQVRHVTAQRDWVCGTCGSRLRTACIDGGWCTVCAADNSHDPDSFVHKHAYAHVEHQQGIERLTAREVYKHLPADLQATITKGE